MQSPTGRAEFLQRVRSISSQSQNECSRARALVARARNLPLSPGVSLIICDLKYAGTFPSDVAHHPPPTPPHVEKLATTFFGSSSMSSRLALGHPFVGSAALDAPSSAVSLHLALHCRILNTNPPVWKVCRPLPSPPSHLFTS